MNSWFGKASDNVTTLEVCSYALFWPTFPSKPIANRLVEMCDNPFIRIEAETDSTLFHSLMFLRLQLSSLGKNTQLWSLESLSDSYLLGLFFIIICVYSYLWFWLILLSWRLIIPLLYIRIIKYLFNKCCLESHHNTIILYGATNSFFW
jgi:hypothetical protein